MISTIEKTDMELKDDVIAELKYEPIVKVTTYWVSKEYLIDSPYRNRSQ